MVAADWTGRVNGTAIGRGLSLYRTSDGLLRSIRHTLTRLCSETTRVLVRGAIAGAVGTAAMDLVWFFRYRRGGGHEGLFAWETSESVGKWDDASHPARSAESRARGSWA